MSERRNVKELGYGTSFRAVEFEVEKGTLVQREDEYLIIYKQNQDTFGLDARKIKKNKSGFFLGASRSISSIAPTEEVIYLGGLAEGVWKNHVAPPLARELRKKNKSDDSRAYGFMGLVETRNKK